MSKKNQANFIATAAAVSAQNMEKAQKSLADTFAAREKADKDAPATRLKSLASSRAKLLQGQTVRTLVAADVDLAFANRRSGSGKFGYNVYAIAKLADLTGALVEGGSMTNAINIAITRSMFRFKAAGKPFTMDLAKAATSKAIRGLEPSEEKLLVRHTVAPSTASTQASSTMQALETLGIVSRSGTKNPVFELTDTLQTRQLEEAVNKLAA